MTSGASLYVAACGSDDPLAYSQNVVVTVPGDTRRFLVLEQGVGREGATRGAIPLLLLFTRIVFGGLPR